MQDESVYDSSNLAYILHMDSLDTDSSMADHNEGAFPTNNGSGAQLQINTDDALLNTQVRRRNSPRKRLSLNLSNLPPPVINLPASDSSGGIRRKNRLSLPQRLMDLEIDGSQIDVQAQELTLSETPSSSRQTLTSPWSKCPRSRVPAASSSSTQSAFKPAKTESSTSSPKQSKRQHPNKVVMTESLEKAVAAVKLRPKSPQKAAQRQSNADFRLSFEMKI